MNPYLEDDYVFHEVHQGLIEAMQRALVPQVRGRYIVQTDKTVYLHELAADERKQIGRPDVMLGDSPARQQVVVSERRTPGAAPFSTQVPMPVNELKLGFVKIVDAHSREVVTVIEVLSPSNKSRSEDRAQYLSKRSRVLSGRCNLVEVDLLRAGEPMPVVDQISASYRVVVARGADLPNVGVWPVQLRDRLPVIPIPLRAGEPDATIDLQAMLHDIYDAKALGDYCYEAALSPPLSADDAAWADAVLSTAGVIRRA